MNNDLATLEKSIADILRNQKRASNISNISGFFSNIAKSYSDINSAIDQRAELRLKTRALRNSRLLKLQDYQDTNDTLLEDMRSLRAKQSAYWASSGLVGATANAISNRDTSRFIREYNRNKVRERIERDFIEQEYQNNMYNIKRQTDDQESVSFISGISSAMMMILGLGI